MVSRLLGLLLVLSCRSLPDLEEDRCGNGVIEANEACDLFVPADLAAPGVSCGNPLGVESEACKLLCRQGTCPPGWACGVDAVCRYPVDGLRAVDAPQVLPSTFMTTADFDGDGLLDLLAAEPLGAAITYGQGEGRFGQTFSEETTLFSGRATVGDLDGDGRSDLLIPRILGIDVLRGARERLLEPQVYETFVMEAVPGTELRWLGWRFNRNCLGDQPTLLLLDRNQNLLSVFAEGSKILTFPVESNASLHESKVPALTADFGGASFLLIAPRGSRRIWVVRALGEGCGDNTLEIVQTLDLPPGRTVRAGLAVADADGDGQPDLFVDVEGPATESVFVALRNMDQFEDLRWDLRFERPVACGLEEDLLSLGFRVPLALSDFNGDRVADVVFGDGIFLAIQTVVEAQTIRGAFCRFAVSGRGRGQEWSEAVVGDFNRDGAADVAATNIGDRGSLEILLGAGDGLFNGVAFALEGPGRLPRVGDFDGDRVDDLAWVEDIREGARLAVIFGETAGRFSPPAGMGVLDDIRTMVAATVPFPESGFADARQDLLVQGDGANGPWTSLTLMQGTSGRRLFAPVTLAEPNVAAQTIPLALSVMNLETSPTNDAAEEVWAITAGTDGFGTSFLWRLPVLEAAHFETRSVQPTALDACGAGLSLGRLCVLTQTVQVQGVARGLVVATGAAGCAFENVIQLRPIASLCYVPVQGEPCSLSVAQGEEALRSPSAVEVADLDQDGASDLVVSFMGDGLGGAGVAVYQGVAGACPFAEPQVLAMPTNTLLGAVAVNANADPALELIILSRNGLHELPFRFDQSVELPPPLPDGPMDKVQADGSLVAPDLDGDGIADYVLSVDRELRVYMRPASSENPGNL